MMVVVPALRYRATIKIGGSIPELGRDFLGGWLRLMERIKRVRGSAGRR